MKKKTNADETESVLKKFFLILKETVRSPLVFVTGALTFAVIVLPVLYTERETTSSLIGKLLLFVSVFYLFFFCLCGHRSTGRKLQTGGFYLLSFLTALYFVLSRIIENDTFYSGIMPVAVILPTALIVMLSSGIVSIRYAKMMGLLLPIGAFIVGSIDFNSFVFSLMSGVTASFVLNNSTKRIDMVLAGCTVALMQVITITALLLINGAPGALYFPILCFAALTGVASGMLVLGITPFLEKILHCATNFKLIELLDLGAPIMRLLATKTPGTFNHSLIVANLAEAACMEIGANGLLARVGAFYHDIGKIDQPEYFVENQRAGNKHDDINPRLSATVIRSHVKLGIEKGRAAGLPDEVIDIIASHHGNGLIAYFYYEALKKEENVEMEDFCYPGNPPRTKEAAVVMLADVTEAAVRTLDKPGASRLEKFINELIMKKVDSDQLSESELTFRELETIKKVFVRVLASYYHTRVEYPNQNKDAPKDDE